jgi:hypothetical protein
MPWHGPNLGAPKYSKHESWDWADKARGQKAEPEEHDRFDHGKRLRPRPLGVYRTMPRVIAQFQRARALT